MSCGAPTIHARRRTQCGSAPLRRHRITGANHHMLVDGAHSSLAPLPYVESMSFVGELWTSAAPRSPHLAADRRLGQPCHCPALTEHDCRSERSKSHKRLCDSTTR